MYHTLLAFISSAFYYTGFFYAVLIAVGWPLCRLRLLPEIAMRIYFVLILLPALILSNIISGILDSGRFLGMTHYQTSNKVAWMCKIIFWIVVALNPHINIVQPDQKTIDAYNAVQPGTMLCYPHYSFFDAFFIVAQTPGHVISNCRTLIKSSLRKLPIFGPVYDRVGHFPVFFKDEAARNSFGVDSEKQKQVTDAMIAWVNRSPVRGSMSIFPEGVLSDTPGTLSPFRHGSLRFALDNKMPFVLVAMWGTHITWPKQDAVGGKPANISLSLRSFTPKPDEELGAMAVRMQNEMQEMIDVLKAAEEKRSGKAQ